MHRALLSWLTRNVGNTGGRPTPLRVHHLTRVPVPAPTRAHPLAGLWVADFTGAVVPPEDGRDAGLQVHRVPHMSVVHS